MLPCQILELEPGEEDSLSSDRPSVETMWKALILLCLKDRADELWIVRKDGANRLWYRVNGSFLELVSPPSGMISAMVEMVRDLSRPKGVRAWIVGRLRAVIRWLEAPFSSGHSKFFAWLGSEGAIVETAPEEGGGVILRFSSSTDLSLRAHQLLGDLFGRVEPSTFVEKPPAASEAGVAGGGELRPD